MDKEITLKLTELEARAIVAGLSHFPYKEVSELISKIEKQLSK